LFGVAIAVLSGICLPKWNGHSPAGLVGMTFLAIAGAFFFLVISAAEPHRHRTDDGDSPADRTPGFGSKLAAYEFLKKSDIALLD